MSAAASFWDDDDDAAESSGAAAGGGLGGDLNSTSTLNATGIMFDDFDEVTNHQSNYSNSSSSNAVAGGRTAALPLSPEERRAAILNFLNDDEEDENHNRNQNQNPSTDQTDTRGDAGAAASAEATTVVAINGAPTPTASHTASTRSTSQQPSTSTASQSPAASSAEPTPTSAQATGAKPKKRVQIMVDGDRNNNAAAQPPPSPPRSTQTRQFVAPLTGLTNIDGGASELGFDDRSSFASGFRDASVTGDNDMGGDQHDFALHDESPDERIAMSILSRVVERYRFIIEDHIDLVVNEEHLVKLFELDHPSVGASENNNENSENNKNDSSSQEDTPQVLSPRWRSVKNSMSNLNDMQQEMDVKTPAAAPSAAAAADAAEMLLSQPPAGGGAVAAPAITAQEQHDDNQQDNNNDNDHDNENEGQEADGAMLQQRPRRTLKGLVRTLMFVSSSRRETVQARTRDELQRAQAEREKLAAGERAKIAIARAEKAERERRERLEAAATNREVMHRPGERLKKAPDGARVSRNWRVLRNMLILKARMEKAARERAERRQQQEDDGNAGGGGDDATLLQQQENASSNNIINNNNNNNNNNTRSGDSSSPTAALLGDQMLRTGSTSASSHELLRNPDLDPAVLDDEQQQQQQQDLGTRTLEMGKKGARGIFNIVTSIADGVRDTVKHSLGEVLDVASGVASGFGIELREKKDTQAKELARELWKRVHIIPAGTTFRHCLEFDNPHFPYTTSEQRRLLRSHNNDRMVSREELAFDLQVETDHPILVCLFGDLQELPKIVYGRVVSCLHEHPHTHAFQLTAAEKCCAAKKNMSLLLNYIVGFILALIMIPLLGIPDMYLVNRSSWDAATGEFVSGCPDGVLRDSCFMIRRQLKDVHTVNMMEKYVHDLIVMELWNEDGVTPGSRDTFFGLVRVGALLVRVSPLRSSSRELRADPNAACPLRPCSALNLSRYMFEFRTGTFFTCESFDPPNSTSTVLVPFNLSRTEALRKIRTWKPDFCEEEDVAVIVSWALFQPSQHILSWSEVRFTVTKGGAVLPRTYTGTMNLRAKPLIRIFAAIHLTMFFWLFCVVLSRIKEGWRRFFTLQMLSDACLSVLNVLALVHIESLPPLDTMLSLILQTEYVPPNIDSYVATYGLANDLLAWWILLFFLMTCQVFADVIGLSVITHLLRVVAADVAVLFILFIVIASSFIAIARCLFGVSTAAFNFSATTTIYLLGFLWGDYDLSKLSQQNPVSGSLFYFAFLAFIIIFVLNLLIAVICSRLGEMSTRANLHTELFASMLGDASNFEEDEDGHNERDWFTFRTNVIPFVSAVVDAMPFIASTMRWKEALKMFSIVYEPVQRKHHHKQSLELLVNTAIELFDFCDAVSPSSFTEVDQHWLTPLRRACDVYNPIPDRTAFIMIERVILAQSSIQLVRDAALVRILIAWDESDTDIQAILDFQKAEEEYCAANRNQLASGVTDRQERFLEAQSRKFDFASRKDLALFQPSAAVAAGGASGAVDGDDAALQARLREEAIAAGSGQVSLARASGLESGAFDAPAEDEQQQQQQQQEGKTTPRSTRVRSGSHFQQRLKDLDGFHRTSHDDDGDSGDDADGGFDERRRQPRKPREVHARDQKFHINQFVVHIIKSHRFFLLKSCLTLGLFCYFFFSLLLFNEPLSWLGENVAQALVHYPYVQQCYDLECKRGHMFDKKFADVGNAEDVGEYIRKLFSPFVFPPSLPYTIPKRFLQQNSSSSSSNSNQQQEQSFPVFWDPMVRRHGPVHVRQLRAAKINCSLPSERDMERLGAQDYRVDMLKELTCYKDTAFLFSETIDREPMEYNETTLLPASAFAFTESCVEQAAILGNWGIYPCSGNIARVDNASQMREVWSDWLDPGAALVVISATFESLFTPGINLEHAGRALRIRIDLYIEMAPGGGGAVVWHYLSGGEQQLFGKFVWVGLLITALDIVGLLFQYARYFYYKHCGDAKKDPARLEQLWPEVRWVPVISTVAVVVLFSVTSIEQSLRESWVLSVLVISANETLLYDVIFPLMKIVTHRASFLIRSLVLSLQLVVIIIPFYVTTTIAFVYSGHLLFGRHALEYSTLRHSLQSIGRGLLTDWDISDIYEHRPFVTVLFCFAFFAVILVVLANLLLTLVTQAVQESKQEAKIVDLIQMSAEFSGQSVFVDEIVAVYLSWHLEVQSQQSWLARCCCSLLLRPFLFFNSAREDREAEEELLRHAATPEARAELLELMKSDAGGGQFFIAQNGRFRRPLESLMFVMPFFRLQELADALRLDSIAEEWIFSIALYLSRTQQRFFLKHADQATMDDVREGRLSHGFRATASSVFSPLSFSM